MIKKISKYILSIILCLLVFPISVKADVAPPGAPEFILTSGFYLWLFLIPAGVIFLTIEALIKLKKSKGDNNDKK